MDIFFHVRFGIKIMEGLACITGFLCWARLYPKFWRAFPFYLLIIVCCEFAGWYMNGHGIKGAKYMYSYFVIPLEFLFMCFLYYHSLAREYGKTVKTLAIIFILAFILENVLLINIKWLWMSLTYATGSITILILSVIYFLDFISKEKVVHYRQEIFFWVNLGLILFYVGTFPYYATINFLYKTNPGLYTTLSWVMLILNYIMYSLFIVGFLCFRKRQTY